MSDPRLRPYGDTGVLVEVDDLDLALAWYAALRARPPEGTVDLVPAERTVLVRLDPAVTTVARAVEDLAGRAVEPGAAAAAGPVVTVPVVYDGPDLASAAAAAGWSARALVAAHQERTWRVAFVGFSPGFGYLVADGDWPDLPRLAVPRTRVPAGSVALAGRYSGVYPAASPGGWQLVGRTRRAPGPVGRRP